MQQEYSNESEQLAQLLERLETLESRVTALESAPTPSGDFWVIDQIKSANHSQPSAERGAIDDAHHGAVVFGGSVSLDGREYEYQWERTADYLTSREWDECVDRIAAIAHPVRGAILRRLLCAPATVSELVEESIVSSTGTGYHHVGALHDTGWIAKLDGHYEVRASRVVPLLTIIAAGEDH